MFRETELKSKTEAGKDLNFQDRVCSASAAAGMNSAQIIDPHAGIDQKSEGR